MQKLRRDLSLYGLTMVAVGSCIGSGIFLTPSQVAAHLGTPGLILSAWALGGLIALTGALTFAELGGMYPQAGGVYVYLKEAYGPVAGFMYGWAYLTVINSGSLAALSLAFTYYVSFVIPVSAAMQTPFAVATIVTITLMNIFRVKFSEYFSNVFTGLKLIGIAAVVLIGLFLGSHVNLTESVAPITTTSGSLAGAFGLAMVGVLWSYGGWQHASYLSGEARDAGRAIPRAMVLGALIVTVVYLLVNLSYMFLLPAAEIAQARSLAADAVQTVIPWGGSLVAIIIAISTLGTALIYMFSAPRIYFAMADDGLFFKKIATVHPRYRTPVNAVLLQSFWAIILLLLWGTFEEVITYVTFTDWIFFMLAACAVILFRYKREDVVRPVRTFGYPLTPLIFITTSFLFVINTLIEKPIQAGAGLALMLIGLLVYRYFTRASRTA